MKILLALGLFFCIHGVAQPIKIEDPRINEKDDRVFITFTLVAEKLKSNERLTLTPVLYHGDQRKNLNPVILTGRNRSITDKRQSASVGIRTKDNQRIPYSVTLPYESWMSEVSLRIDRKKESCCTEQILASQTIVEAKPIRYDVIRPEIALFQAEISPLTKLDTKAQFLAPMNEYKSIKENFDEMRAEGALIVRFRQGRNIIDPTFEQNANSLAQVYEVLELIANDPSASIGKIVLAGASSPEGSAQRNGVLAQLRVQVLQDFLKDKMPIDISQLESINIGEDWTGLRKMVEQSSMQYKNEVLEIINYVPVLQGREKQLMDLKGGRPYTYMMEHFFPKLRSAGYIRVFYEAKPDVAFEKANEAVELCNNKEYRDALTRLEGIPSTAKIEYIRGVCHMMLDELDKAGTSLNKAVKLGSTEAAESIEQLEKLKAVQR